jgi:hypothetical protein
MASARLGRSPGFERGVVEFADLNADHVVLVAAVKSGPVATETGV